MSEICSDFLTGVSYRIAVIMQGSIAFLLSLSSSGDPSQLWLLCQC